MSDVADSSEAAPTHIFSHAHSEAFATFWVIPRNTFNHEFLRAKEIWSKKLIPYKKTESKRRARENLKRAINNMVDNLKSCNLQGTATGTDTRTDTDTNANECRSHYGW